MSLEALYSEKILRITDKTKPFPALLSAFGLKGEQGREMRNDSGVYANQKMCVKCANTYSRSFHLIGLTISINNPGSAKQLAVPDSSLSYQQTIQEALRDRTEFMLVLCDIRCSFRIEGTSTLYQRSCT